MDMAESAGLLDSGGFQHIHVSATPLQYYAGC